MTPAGSVELQKQSFDLEEGSHLLAVKQRKPSARSYLDFQAGPDAISDSSSNEGEADSHADRVELCLCLHAHKRMLAWRAGSICTYVQIKSQGSEVLLSARLPQVSRQFAAQTFLGRNSKALR